MTFVAIFPASYPTDPSYIYAIVGLYIFPLACIGIVLGYVMEKKVKGKFMITGSAVYWVLTLLFLSAVVGQVSTVLLYENPVLYHSFNVAFWSTFLVLFADIAYAVRYISERRKKQPLC